MSRTLKNLIAVELKELLEKQSNRIVSGDDIFPEDGSGELNYFIEAISFSVAKAVQTYLTTNVRVAPGQSVATAGSPSAQTGETTSPGTLIVP